MKKEKRNPVSDFFAKAGAFALFVSLAMILGSIMEWSNSNKFEKEVKKYGSTKLNVMSFRYGKEFHAGHGAASDKTIINIIAKQGVYRAEPNPDFKFDIDGNAYAIGNRHRAVNWICGTKNPTNRHHCLKVMKY